MKITKAIESDIIINKNDVKAQRLYDTADAMVNHLTFQPGARLKTHTTPVNVFFYILEGKAWVEIGEERIAVDKDSIVESPKDIPHALENSSLEEILRVMVVKLPHP